VNILADGAVATFAENGNRQDTEMLKAAAERTQQLGECSLIRIEQSFDYWFPVFRSIGVTVEEPVII
jgi:hypothetical protein